MESIQTTAADTLQKFSIPLAIVVAGALVAGAVYFSGSGGTPSAEPGAVLEDIRGVEENDHVRGSADAKVVIVEFSDFECPFCKVFHETMKRITSEYSAGDVAWVYRHWPIPQLHPKAGKEAEGAECAAEQGGSEMFWKFADAVFEATDSNNSLDIGIHNTPSPTPVGPDGKPYYAERAPRSSTDAGEMSDIAAGLGLDKAAFEQCLISGKYAERIAADVAEVGAAGGTGTPHSILIANGKQIAIEGAQSYDTVKRMIEEALK